MLILSPCKPSTKTSTLNSTASAKQTKVSSSVVPPTSVEAVHPTSKMPNSAHDTDTSVRPSNVVSKKRLGVVVARAAAPKSLQVQMWRWFPDFPWFARTGCVLYVRTECSQTGFWGFERLGLFLGLLMRDGFQDLRGAICHHHTNHTVKTSKGTSIAEMLSRASHVQDTRNLLLAQVAFLLLFCRVHHSLISFSQLEHCPVSS